MNLNPSTLMDLTNARVADIYRDSERHPSAKAVARSGQKAAWRRWPVRRAVGVAQHALAVKAATSLRHVDYQAELVPASGGWGGEQGPVVEEDDRLMAELCQVVAKFDAPPPAVLASALAALVAEDEAP